METPPPPQYTNYPRPGPYGSSSGPNPYWRPPGVYFDAIGDAWRMVQEDLGVWVGTSALFLLGFVVQGFASVFIMNGGQLIHLRGAPVDLTTFVVGQVISIALTLVAVIMQTGMMWMAVKKARGQSIRVADAFTPFRRFGTIFGTLFLSCLAYIVGFVLCIIPGFYVVGALSLATLIAFDQEVNPIEAVSRSWKTIGGSAWLMFCLLFVVGILNWVGTCLCGVGILFTLPVYVATIGLHYHYYFPPVDAVTSVGYIPPTHNF